MTICIGMLATDGLVIAADALESDSYFKRPVQKIMTWFAPARPGESPYWPAACLIAGAGDSGFIDAFCVELLKGIRSGMSMNNFEEYAQGVLSAFYSQHVLPCLPIDINHDFRVIIGASFGGAQKLFVSYKSTLRWHMGGAVAIGIGMQYAHRLMAQHPIGDVRHVEISAACVMFNTKDCIEGCGNSTDIVTLHNPKIITDGSNVRVAPPDTLWSRVNPEKIARWEESFGSLWEGRQSFLYRNLIEEELVEEDKSA